MKQIILFLIPAILCGGCCSENNPQPAKSIILKPGLEGKDAEVTSYYPDVNFGTRLSLDGEAWTAEGTPYTERGYIDFDLSSIPSGAVIKRATLKLYADTSTPYPHTKGHSVLSGPNDWVLQQVRSSWNENTITWNTQPATDATTQINLPASSSSSEAYSIDVTGFIKNEFNAPGSYFGFCLKLSDELYYREILFCSSDHSYSQLHPELYVEYNK